jgi:hypothetical protein
MGNQKQREARKERAKRAKIRREKAMMTSELHISCGKAFTWDVYSDIHSLAPASAITPWMTTTRMTMATCTYNHLSIRP